MRQLIITTAIAGLALAGGHLPTGFTAGNAKTGVCRSVLLQYCVTKTDCTEVTLTGFTNVRDCHEHIREDFTNLQTIVLAGAVLTAAWLTMPNDDDDVEFYLSATDDTPMIGIRWRF